MSFTHKADVELSIERCYKCGRFWAAERCGHNTTCPFCAKASMEQARANEEKARRAASSLKGAYSKLKNSLYKVVDTGSSTKPFVMKRGS